jgi:hypothetical protein
MGSEAALRTHGRGAKIGDPHPRWSVSMNRLSLVSLTVACLVQMSSASAAGTGAAAPNEAVAASAVDCLPLQPPRGRHHRIRHVRSVVQLQPVKDVPAPATPAVLPPPAFLSTGNERCFGSIDGKALRDDGCERRRDATLLWNMGKYEAAVAVLCDDPKLRLALERAGSACQAPAPAGPVPMVASNQVQR